MSKVNSKAFWIAFPLAVTAVSILGVSKLRQHTVALSTPTANAPDSARSENSTSAPQPVVVTIPAKTEIEVRLDQSIATDRTAAGDPFFATVADPVVVNGQTVIPLGAPAQGRVVSVHRAGRLKGVAQIRLALVSVEVNGGYYDLHSNTYTRFGKNHKKRNWEIIGGGSGGGALLGALAGGGKGLLIGAPIGAGAGIAGAALTGKKNLVIPAETAMTFRLLEPVEMPM